MRADTVDTARLWPEAPAEGELHLAPVPLADELLAWQAADFAELWFHLAEAHPGGQAACPPPYWATVWPGGAALARYLLDRPRIVAGRAVLDLGAGAGVVALAAAAAGARRVVALDSDPAASRAVAANARANALTVAAMTGDALTWELGAWPVILAGDMCYEGALAGAIGQALGRASAGGADVLIGDPGRAHAPAAERVAVRAAYALPDDLRLLEDAKCRTARVMQLGAPPAQAATEISSSST